MKKYFMILIILIFIQRISFATPVIGNVSVNPQQLWVGESTYIYLNCFDDENKTIEDVYADITGPGVILPRLDFIGNYILYLNKYYLDRTGQYNVKIYCNNTDNQTTTTSTSFAVSSLTGYISSIQPSIGYIGNELEIDFFVKKDEIPLSSGVNFSVVLNSQSKQLKVSPAYDLIKGWILKIDSPDTEGIYTLDVYANYDRASVTNSSSIEIRKKIDFNIVSLSKGWIEGNENITFSIKAKDSGSIIDVNKNNLNVQIASINLGILSINKNGDLYDVKVTSPSISAGTYDLTATLNYEGNYYSSTTTVDYIVSINGKIVDINNKGIDAQLRFLSGNVEKLKVSTDSNGYYSGKIPPGYYDIQISFPQSTLYLENALVNDFNDPIKYFYSTDNIVPGIRNAGLFAYGVAINYDKADIEMEYNENNVLDETMITAFQCSIWNSGRKICNGKWIETGETVDDIRNIVEINQTSLSAFVVGERKLISANFNLDNQNYYAGDVIKVRGIAKDVDGDAVQNATIKAYVKSSQISMQTYSDNNGVFSFEFNAPEDEGNYTLALNIEKYPYLSFNGSINFNVSKNRELSIVFPDTIKLKQGQNLTQEISITNIGQADLSNLNITLTGIPDSYYNMTTFIEKLKENEETRIYLHFSAPEDAEKKTYSVTLSIFNNEIHQDKIFGFTVEGKNETIVENTPSPAGSFILPKLDSNLTGIIIFAVCCFSVAIVLKKMKIKRSKRDDIKDFLFEVKGYFKKRKINFAKFVNTDYRDLISSEFPDALKNKDKYGKDN